MDLHAYGTLTAAEPGARELTYRLLPFGEPGRTSRGVVTASAASVTLPTDPAVVVLNREHDRTSPLGRARVLDARRDGLYATFTIAPTAAGDELLAEAAAGLRTGVSVELDQIVIRGGRLLASTLTGAGAVVTPAFPSAQLVAADTPEGDPMTDQPVAPVEPAVEPTVELETEPETTEPTPTLDASRRTGAPALVAARRRGPAAPAAPSPAELIAAAVRGELRPSQLDAALDDLVHVPAAFPETWLGQIWSAVVDRRPLIDTFGVIPATTLTYAGFKVTDGLHVDDYAGDKAEIPTNTPTITGVTQTLSRMAGGVDVDRAYIDLGASEVIDAIVAWAIRDYRKKTEAKVVTAALAAATSAGAAAAPVATMAAVVAKLVGNGGNLDGLFISADVLGALAGISPAYAFLAGGINLGNQTTELGDVTFAVHPNLPAKTVLAVDRRAAEYREKVIEVNALDIAKAGVDEAVYGYYGFLVTDAAGMVKGATT